MAYELNTSSTGYREGVVGARIASPTPGIHVFEAIPSIIAGAPPNFVAGDVGRIIRIISGDGAGQIRWITQYIDADTVYIDSPWDEEPFRAFNNGDTPPERMPAEDISYTTASPASTGSTYQLSFTMAELMTLAPAGDITAVGNVYTVTNQEIRINGATLQCEDLTLITNLRNNWRSSPTSNSAVVFGRLDAGDVSDSDGVPYAHHGVTIVDTSGGAFGENEFEPQFHVYGSKFSSPVGSTFNFFRFNGSDDTLVRFFDNNITGNFGGRFQGERSVFLNNTVSTARTNGGFFNPVSSSTSFFGVNQGNRFFDCEQAVYHWFEEGGTAETNVEAFVDLTEHVARLLSGGVDGGDTLTFRNLPIRDYNVLQGGINSNGTVPTTIPLVNNDFFDPPAAGRAQDSWRIIQDVDVSVVDEKGAAITDQATLYYVDRQGTEVATNLLTTSGSFDRISLLYDTRQCGTSSNDQFIEQPTSSARLYPYQMVVAVNGRVPQFVQLNLEAIGGVPEEIQLVMTADNNVTDTNSVDTIAGLDTEGDGLASAEGYSNAQAHYKFQNPEIPSTTSELFTRSGNDIEFTDAPLFDVEIDFDATEPIVYDAASSILRLGVAAGGSSANFIPRLTRSLNFAGTTQVRSVVRGGFGSLGNPAIVNFSFPTPELLGTLIQTDEDLYGTITLPSGSYVIDRVNGATLDNLTIARASGQTGNVNIVVRNATGNPTFDSSEVQLITTLNVTINGPAAGVGRLALHQGAAPYAFITDVAGPTNTFSTVTNNLIVGDTDVIIVYSGPSHADVRTPFRIGPGSNNIAISPAPSQAPTFDAAQFVNVQGADPVYDLVGNNGGIADKLAISLALVVPSAGNPLESSSGFNAWFHNRIKGSRAYNHLIGSNPTAINAALSIGDTSFVEFNGDFIKLRPKINASINVGYIDNNGSEEIAVDRTISGATFTPPGETNPVTQDITFRVTIFDNPDRFDLIAVTNSIDELLDDTQNGVAYVTEVLSENPIITSPGGNASYVTGTDYKPFFNR